MSEGINFIDIYNSNEDFLRRMQLSYVDVGMIHYIDDEEDFNTIFNGEIIKYAEELKEKGIVKSLGISTHNPDIAFRAVKTGLIDVILFSINAAYDMLQECCSVIKSHPPEKRLHLFNAYIIA